MAKARKKRTAAAVGTRAGFGQRKPAGGRTSDFKLSKLMPHHWVFMRAYVRTMNATQSYMEAFPGVQPSTAATAGSRLYADPLIQQELKVLLDNYAKKMDISVERVLGELAKVAFVDASELFEETDGGCGVRLKTPKEWEGVLASAIQSVEVETIYERTGKTKRVVGHLHKIKLYDKLSALEKLGKNLQLFVERHELTGKDGKDLFPKDKSAEIDVARRLAFILNRGRKAADKKQTA